MYSIRHFYIFFISVHNHCNILYVVYLKWDCTLIILDDHCRVVLSGDEKDDYINASYIDVSSSLISPT